MENMLGDKAPKSRSCSFYIENLLRSPDRETEVCLERSCKSPRFNQIKLVVEEYLKQKIPEL